ncbi:MAG TPA: hypothetical protein VEC57_18950 [Candidatus Limnocylindrales bacterium]|nr:hypothetical protein [Candidatus Limnocylindrales bacterium]
MKHPLALATMLGVAMIHGSAFAQEQSKDQQQCINAMNKGMAKVARAYNKAFSKCVTARASGEPQDIFACAGNDAKLVSAQGKNLDQQDKHCAQTPDFGFTSAGNVNSRTEFEAANFAGDVFGSNSGVTLCGTDAAGCKCQAKVFKSATRLYKAHLKAFNKCKKQGLKDSGAAFDDAADVATCVSQDRKSKLAKSAGKIGTTVEKKCGGVATPFSEGSCDGLTGGPLADCLQAQVRCHVCLTETIGDNLSFDCDTFDDGNGKNGSCFDKS